MGITTVDLRPLILLPLSAPELALLVVPLINLDRVATDVNAWRSSVQQLVTNRYWCYLNRADSARKNSAGVAMRSDVR